MFTTQRARHYSTSEEYSNEQIWQGSCSHAMYQEGERSEANKFKMILIMEML